MIFLTSQMSYDVSVLGIEPFTIMQSSNHCSLVFHPRGIANVTGSIQMESAVSIYTGRVIYNTCKRANRLKIMSNASL